MSFYLIERIILIKDINSNLTLFRHDEENEWSSQWRIQHNGIDKSVWTDWSVFDDDIWRILLEDVLNSWSDILEKFVLTNSVDYKRKKTNHHQ